MRLVGIKARLQQMDGWLCDVLVSSLWEGNYTDRVHFVHLFLQKIAQMSWHAEFTQQRAHTGWTTLHTG